MEPPHVRSRSSIIVALSNQLSIGHGGPQRPSETYFQFRKHLLISHLQFKLKNQGRRRPIASADHFSVESPSGPKRMYVDLKAERMRLT
jgi:hypothetical protein